MKMFKASYAIAWLFGGILFISQSLAAKENAFQPTNSENVNGTQVENGQEVVSSPIPEPADTYTAVLETFDNGLALDMLYSKFDISAMPLQPEARPRVKSSGSESFGYILAVPLKNSNGRNNGVIMSLQLVDGRGSDWVYKPFLSGKINPDTTPGRWEDQPEKFVEDIVNHYTREGRTSIPLGPEVDVIVSGQGHVVGYGDKVLIDRESYPWKLTPTATIEMMATDEDGLVFDRYDMSVKQDNRRIQKPGDWVETLDKIMYVWIEGSAEKLLGENVWDHVTVGVKLPLGGGPIVKRFGEVRFKMHKNELGRLDSLESELVSVDGQVTIGPHFAFKPLAGWEKRLGGEMGVLMTVDEATGDRTYEPYAHVGLAADSWTKAGIAVVTDADFTNPRIVGDFGKFGFMTEIGWYDGSLHLDQVRFDAPGTTVRFDFLGWIKDPLNKYWGEGIPGTPSTTEINTEPFDIGGKLEPTDYDSLTDLNGRPIDINDDHLLFWELNSWYFYERSLMGDDYLDDFLFREQAQGAG